MYARRIKFKNQRWNCAVHPDKYLCTSSGRDCYIGKFLSSGSRAGYHTSRGSLIERLISRNWSSVGLHPESRFARLHDRSDISWRRSLLRLYSSEGDGRNASEDKCAAAKDVFDCHKDKSHNASTIYKGKKFDAHARLGELDQMEWLKNEKLAIESKHKESPFLTRRARFRNEFLRRIVPWDKITVSWDTFPYYIHEPTKNALVECTASHLRHKKFTADYGGNLTSSSGKILLQSVPGTELYRERLVRALAQDLRVPLLVLDGSVLAPYDAGEDCSSESESDEECASDSENEDMNGVSNEEDYTSSGETNSSDNEIDLQASAEALKKLIPCNLEEFEKRVSGDPESSSSSASGSSTDHSDIATRHIKKGDRVKYTGPVKEKNREISIGQRGEVYEVNGDQVAVIFETSVKFIKEEEHDDKSAEPADKPSLCWVNVKDIEHDPDAESHDCYVAMEVLCEILESQQPLIVYFPDSSLWLSRAVSKSNRRDFVNKLEEMFGKLSGPVVMICGQNVTGTAPDKEKLNFTMILPSLSRLAKLPLPLKRLAEGLKGTTQSEKNEISKLFTNEMTIPPPTEEDLLKIFNKQIEDDKIIVTSRSNLYELHKVLEEHDLSCPELLHVNTDGVILTNQKALKVVGWAKNHYLSSCLLPSVKGERLQLPRESLETAIARLREQESWCKKSSQNLKSLAKDEYETNFVSTVVPPGEIGVKFDDVGALEEVKKALNELVILPMRRPELFTHGNLLRPCKGVLLFGPPGTGKTLLAKALATEAGANFISITGSSLTSKWFGDAEKLTRGLFSFASRLAPVIIFVDEVDSLLGARGGSFEHEATRRMRNEFMAAWDGLRSKDSDRILILGATNRPFDLDDAVIRRLPRRIYVDLPDAVNRLKILKIILKRENLESDFSFEELAKATDGYSGSDLKNLCIAAAYRPVQELIENESKNDRSDGGPELRPLNLNDFIQAKAKVGASVAYDAASMNELRKWNDQYGEGGSRSKSPFGF